MLPPVRVLRDVPLSSTTLPASSNKSPPAFMRSPPPTSSSVSCCALGFRPTSFVQNSGSSMSTSLAPSVTKAALDRELRADAAPAAAAGPLALSHETRLARFKIVSMSSVMKARVAASPSSLNTS